MSGQRGKEDKKEGKRGGKKEEQEKKSEETRQTSRVTWLGLGEEWGVVRDVRKMIYKMLTPLERVTVEEAHGLGRAFEKTQGKRVRMGSTTRTFGSTSMGSWEWLSMG